MTPHDPYGYLLVHFIEDPDHYAERIYLDLSEDDDPERWHPLNGGRPILTSTLGTKGCATHTWCATPKPAGSTSSPPTCGYSAPDMVPTTAPTGTDGRTTAAPI